MFQKYNFNMHSCSIHNVVLKSCNSLKVIIAGSPSNPLTAITVITYVSPCCMSLMLKVVWLYIKLFTGGTHCETSDSCT